MKNRKQYMDGEIDHNQYYEQFVTNEVLFTVANSIGVKNIKESKDPHFNDIPLSKWDMLKGSIPMGKVAESNASTNGGVKAYSLSDVVSLAKAAARIIKNQEGG